MDFTLYWFMFPVAIVVATCAMLSGIGGAALFTPIFVLIFPLLGAEYALETTAAAIVTALITQTFGFLSGFIGYRRRRLIDYQLAARLLRVTVPIAIIGALVASWVRDGVLIAAYALLVLGLAISLWHRQRSAANETQPPLSEQTRTIVDSRGVKYHYSDPNLTLPHFTLSGVGAFMTGLVSVGIGEVTITLLNRLRVPIAVAAATSVLVVIVTVFAASTTLAVQMIRESGWQAVPWHLICYDVPGVLIGGQIGPRLQGLVPQRAMQQAISGLFMVLAIAMMTVAWRKLSG